MLVTLVTIRRPGGNDLRYPKVMLFFKNIHYRCFLPPTVDQQDSVKTAARMNIALGACSHACTTQTKRDPLVDTFTHSAKLHWVLSEQQSKP